MLSSTESWVWNFWPSNPRKAMDMTHTYAKKLRSQVIWSKDRVKTNAQRTWPIALPFPQTRTVVLETTAGIVGSYEHFACASHGAAIHQSIRMLYAFSRARMERTRASVIAADKCRDCRPSHQTTRARVVPTQTTRRRVVIEDCRSGLETVATVEVPWRK